ncbi:MAG: DNA-directed RNA polymerase subunit omega [Clostridiales bacterium]|nr:DNA-directed RNA polymerase subunit omega [Clostridiales bacterium]
MFNPDLSSVLKDHLSRYSLVTATAKLARDISDEATENGESIIEKPVSLALDRILDGEYKIVEPAEIRDI